MERDAQTFLQRALPALILPYLALEAWFVYALGALFRLAEGQPPVTFPVQVKLMVIGPVFLVPLCLLALFAVAPARKKAPALHRRAAGTLWLSAGVLLTDAVSIALFVL